MMNVAFPVILCVFLALAAVRLFCGERAGLSLNEFNRQATMPLRALLAVLVVVGHCAERFPDDPILRFVHFPTPAVAVFFFLSGYGLVKSYSTRGERYLAGLLPHSAVKLFVPWLSAALLWTLFLVIVGGLQNARSTFEKFLIHGYNYPPHSWFVFSLFIMYAFFFASFRQRNQVLRLSAFVLFVALYYVGFKYCAHWRFYWWKTAPNIAVGAVCAAFEGRIKAQISRHGGVFYVFAGAGLLILVYMVSFDSAVPIPLDDILHWTYGVAVLLIVYVFRVGSGFVGRCLSWMGVISLEIYLIHGIVECCVVILRVNPLAATLFILSASIVSAFVLHKVNSFFVMFLGRVLIEGKAR